MKKLILSFVVFLFLISANTLSQRINHTINSGWFFHKGALTENHDFTDLEEWQQINLPHTWNNKDAFDETSGYYQGTGWYAKILRIPSEWENKKVYLHFEGANQETEVYINHQKVGSHVGGYTAFRFDITPYINVGEKNLLTVKVSNAHNDNIPPLRADFTFYGGICRNVRLIATDVVHFDMDDHASDGVYVNTANISRELAVVTLSGKIFNSHKKQQQVLLETILTDHISGTNNNPLYQTFNEGLHKYRFDVSEGYYDVTVCLVEPDKKNPDKELIYNLSINDDQKFIT